MTSMKLCLIYQWLLARCWAPGQTLPKLLRAHFQDCPGCREMYQHHERIAQRLAAQADTARTPAPPFLEGKILAALEREGSPMAHGRVHRRPAWALAALAATGAVVAGILSFQHFYSAARRDSQVAALNNVVAAAQPFTATVKLANGKTLVAWSDSLEKPLKTEIQSVVIDAKNAVDGLAKTLLPGDMKWSTLLAKSN